MSEWTVLVSLLDSSQFMGGINNLRRDLPGYELEDVVRAWCYAKARVMHWDRLVEVLADELHARGHVDIVEEDQYA